MRIQLACCLLAVLVCSCVKKYSGCPKEGYEYINETSLCWYSPVTDSIRLGDTITVEASIPKRFEDARSNTTVTNTASIVEGPLGVTIIYPTYQAAVDSFELTSEIGKVIKDTVQFSEGILKGSRTIQWDGNLIDSFRIKLSIKALARGIYAVSLRQQSAKDKDCALYKYFLRPGNADQHLNYWMDAFGNVSDEVVFFAYCFKVY